MEVPNLHCIFNFIRMIDIAGWFSSQQFVLVTLLVIEIKLRLFYRMIKNLGQPRLLKLQYFEKFRVFATRRCSASMITTYKVYIKIVENAVVPISLTKTILLQVLYVYKVRGGGILISILIKSRFSNRMTK